MHDVREQRLKLDQGGRVPIQDVAQRADFLPVLLRHLVDQPEQRAARADRKTYRAYSLQNDVQFHLITSA